MVLSLPGAQEGGVKPHPPSKQGAKEKQAREKVNLETSNFAKGKLLKKALKDVEDLKEKLKDATTKSERKLDKAMGDYHRMQHKVEYLASS